MIPCRRTSALSRLIAGILVIGLVALPTTATAMSRHLVMDRAEQWRVRTMVYSKTEWADEAGATVNSSSLGWRRDCSGFVSMAWNLARPGATTRTLNYYADSITKEALQPGDALVAYDQHTVLFGGWANPQHVSYWAYEMSSSQSKAGDGTVMRITPYPYWGYAPNSTVYKPYRLKNITDSIDYAPYISAIEGSNRYHTAVKAAQTAFGTTGATTVVIASGTDWPDALGASALAGAVDGPVLLTSPITLPDTVKAEITALGAHDAIIVGGSSAVSTAVAQELTDTKVSVSRISGPDRYATAAAIASETVKRLKAAGGTYSGSMFVVTGTGFADALAASSFAAAQTTPILLTDPDALSKETSTAIGAIGARNVTIVGGENAVSTAVASALQARLGTANVTRVYGSDRYHTVSALLASRLAASGLSYSGLAIVTGENFPDALSGGVMAARMGTFMVLTPSQHLQPSVAKMLMNHVTAVGVPHLLGGDSALSPIVRESVALALGGH